MEYQNPEEERIVVGIAENNKIILIYLLSRNDGNEAKKNLKLWGKRNSVVVNFVGS